MLERLNLSRAEVKVMVKRVSIRAYTKKNKKTTHTRHEAWAIEALTARSMTLFLGSLISNVYISLYVCLCLCVCCCADLGLPCPDASGSDRFGVPPAGVHAVGAHLAAGSLRPHLLRRVEGSPHEVTQWTRVARPLQLHRPRYVLCVLCVLCCNAARMIRIKLRNNGE